MHRTGAGGRPTAPGLTSGHQLTVLQGRDAETHWTVPAGLTAQYPGLNNGVPDAGKLDKKGNTWTYTFREVKPNHSGGLSKCKAALRKYMNEGLGIAKLPQNKTVCKVVFNVECNLWNIPPGQTSAIGSGSSHFDSNTTTPELESY